MGIFDKIKKFADEIDKKVENLDNSIKEFDNELKMDDGKESNQESQSSEPKKPGALEKEEKSSKLKKDIPTKKEKNPVKKKKKKKNNPSGWDKPWGGEDWRVSPPEDTDDDYAKEKKLNISMENNWVYYVRNNSVFRAQPEYIDFDEYPHLKDNPDYKNNCETINAMMVADNVKMKKGLFYFIDDNGDVCSTDKEHIYEAWNDWIEQNAVYDKKAEYESQQALEDEKIDKEIELRNNIIELLKNNTEKFTASDIDARLKSFDVDLVKEICEELYHEGTINRTGNYRYYIFSENEQSSDNLKKDESEEVDVENELEKFKGMLDKGLITQEDYDAKKKELLGL